MLLSFLNKDPISAAQHSGLNNNFPDSPMHTMPSDTNSNTHLDKVPARQCILPLIDKIKSRITQIEQICNRTLTSNEKEQLNDINQLKTRVKSIGITFSEMNAIQNILTDCLHYQDEIKTLLQSDKLQSPDIYSKYIEKNCQYKIDLPIIERLKLLQNPRYLNSYGHLDQMKVLFCSYHTIPTSVIYSNHNDDINNELRNVEILSTIK